MTYQLLFFFLFGPRHISQRKRKRIVILLHTASTNNSVSFHKHIIIYIEIEKNYDRGCYKSRIYWSASFLSTLCCFNLISGNNNKARLFVHKTINTCHKEKK